RVAVTSGHGRRTVVWDLTTGRIRHVLGGHRGWSACVTCTEAPPPPPLALTGGADNPGNVWDPRPRRRPRPLRLVPPSTFPARPGPAGRTGTRGRRPHRGRAMTLGATTDGMVRALLPRGFGRGARRAGAVSADVVETVLLGDKQPFIVTATGDGIIRLWRPEA